MNGQDQPQDLDKANQIDAICDRFESEWRGGKRPDIETFLKKQSDLENETELPLDTLLIELIDIDIEYRRKLGETPRPQEYATKFPQFAATILKLSSGNEEETAIRPTSLQSELASEFQNFGRYELHQELGHGGFGIVRKAWDTELERWVAIKIARVSDSQGIRRLFRREARALASMDDPYVVRVIDFGIESELAYIVFELVEGQNLAQVLKSRNIDIDEALELTIQVAKGLQHAHERGVIHRDLKPSNVLINSEGRAVVADFGLARQVDSLSTVAEAGQVFGTFPFMSPEQIEGRDVNRTTDVYSLGVLLFRLVTNEHPFEGTREELRRKVVNDPPPDPSSLNPAVSKSLAAVCLKAMEKRPENRFRTMEEMKEALESLLAGETVVLERASWFKRFQQEHSLSRREAILGTTALGLSTLAAFRFLPWSTSEMAASTLPIPPKRIDDVDIPVSLTTNPPGAKLVLHPIDAQTGLPQPEKRIVVEEVTPVELELKPGNYLVVAYFDDGRFHEVYRHVRAPQEQTFQQGFNHIFSKILDNGRHFLPTIEIPEQAPTQGMVQVAGHNGFTLLPYYRTEKPRHYRIPDFYVDQYEVTQGERRDQFSNSAYKEKFITDGPDYPVRKHHGFDRFVAAAEGNGKRLLTELEFYYAATNGGTTTFPWGDVIPPEAQDVGPELQPVGQPEFDQTRHDPPIFGLCSGVAEWVDSQLRFSLDDAEPAKIMAMNEHRFAVKGGSRRVILGDLIVTAEDRNPRTNEYIHRLDTFPGLGCRFARSVKPRLLPEDFLAPL